jgi:hypothetical protein
LALRRPEVRLDLRPGAERRAARVGGDLRPVVRHGPQSDQAFRAQQAEHLGEEFVERRPVRQPEVGQRVVVHDQQAGQPAKGRGRSCSHRRATSRAEPTPRA